MSDAARPAPRLAPLPAEEWGDAEYEAFGTLLGAPGHKVPRAGSGHRFDPLNFEVVGLLVRNPELARAFWVFNGYQLQRSPLPIRWRELAILRVASRRRSAYEWGQHVKIALEEAGISQAEIDALATGTDGFERFDGVDRLVLEATDELIDDGRLGDGSWARLNDALGTRQVMDLIFVVGTYMTLAMAFESWGLAPEPGTAPLPKETR